MTVPLAPDTWTAAPAVPAGRGVLVLRTQRARERRSLLLACALVAAALAAAAIAAVFVADPGATPIRSLATPGAVGRMTLPTAVADSAVIYDTAVMPLAPEEASAINAERALDVTRVVPAMALRIAAENADGVGYAAALRCLTQAVYYEAAGESEEGQRAVAQVVLNRLRHPAFPNTICGVVYQGSDRITGCQFSFTCDGSLARTPSTGSWARAERIARAALSGTVAATVGNATHYHANYVVPYWAPTLDKAATIGAHIFYIMRGFLGSPRAFSARYDVVQEAPPGSLLVTPEALGGEQAGLFDPLGSGPALVPGVQSPVEDSRSGSLISGAAATGFDWARPSALRADEQIGELKPDRGGALKADYQHDAGNPPTEAQDPAPN